MLTTEHAFARMIVVRTSIEADEVQELLAEGGSFADIARERSIDGDPDDRGKLVPVIKSFQDYLVQFKGKELLANLCLIQIAKERHYDGFFQAFALVR